MINPLQDLLQRHVDSGAIPGVVAVLGGAQSAVVSAGVASVGGASMRGDEIFRIQSMTKAITSVAALRLVEAGTLSLDGGLEKWLPELSNLSVLTSPTADLNDVVPSKRPTTLRHLLTNASGYGMILADSPLQAAMAVNQTEAGPQPVSLGADEWLRHLSDLPLAFQPGEGWRYHHSFGILGILLSRVANRPLEEFLAEDLLQPLGMHDTSSRVPLGKADRLPAAYRHDTDTLTTLESEGGGFYVGAAPFDVSHGELVSTAHDYRRFLLMLAGGGVLDGRRYLSAKHLELMTTNQVADINQTPDSFFPGFWEGMGWGFGLAVQTEGPHKGRYGWSGGLGTDFFVDPDTTIGILLTQVEMGERLAPLLEEFQSLPTTTGPDPAAS